MALTCVSKVASRLPAVALSGTLVLGQVVHTRVPLSLSSIGWYRSRAAMPCGWEVNRRSGVALAMPCVTDFSGLSTYGLIRHTRKGDEHPAYTSHFTFTLTVDRVGRDGPCSQKFCLKYRSLTLKMPWIISRFRLPSASTTPNALNIHGTPSNTSIVSAPDRRVQ